MIIILLFCLNLYNALEWSKTSWRSKHIKQIPIYSNIDELQKVENKLFNCSPIIFAGESDELINNLAKIKNENKFLLIGGDCTETFNEFNINKIKDLYKLILQMSLIISFGGCKSVIKVGRIAGQFTNSYSKEFETINGSNVLTYRGDIINDIYDREPNPNKMLDAYHQSTQTLNILRAFSSGGFANINDVNLWNLNIVQKISKYKYLVKKIEENLKFMKILGVDLNEHKFKQINFYTAHECLLLNYEEALTRIDSRTNKTYCCSGHLLWLDEITRDIDGAHVEFLRGINNPIGIIISENIDINELLYLINLINPNNLAGKIILMIKMNSKNLKLILPEIIKSIQKNTLNVVWCCKPIHEKTKLFDDIKKEIITFFNIHKKCGTIPGGIHLKITSNDNKLNYLSTHELILNHEQSLEIAFLVARLLKKN